MGFISGMRIKALDEKKCVVSVPYKWLNTVSYTHLRAHET